MKKLTVSDDIVPLAKFKASISKYLKSIKETGNPLIITKNGKPAGVLITPKEYDNLTYDRLFTESINRGIKNIDSEEFYTTDELKDRIKSARTLRDKK